MHLRVLGIFILLSCMTALAVACRPVQRELAGSQAPAGQADGTVLPTDPPETQIANAMSAAPMVVAKDATVLGFPVEDGGDMVVLRTGPNGWTCYADWPATPTNDPVCYDPVFSVWGDDLAAATAPTITAPGVSYMLVGGADASNTDPMAAAPAAGEDWVISPAHIMVVAPSDLDPALFSTDPKSGYPYIMWEGTSFEHLMIPVVPAVAKSNGPLTAAASAEEQIANMRSAAPAAVVENATLLGYPTEAGGDMVVLKEGTNGWVCHPDRLVSPGDDPACDDPIMMEGFTNGTARSVPQVGLSYMLAGGSDESNTDPMALEPPPGEAWVATPPHVMMMVPGGLDVTNFTTDHTSGYPYIMYDDTDYEHLMIPVRVLP